MLPPSRHLAYSDALSSLCTIHVVCRTNQIVVRKIWDYATEEERRMLLELAAPLRRRPQPPVLFKERPPFIPPAFPSAAEYHESQKKAAAEHEAKQAAKEAEVAAARDAQANAKAEAERKAAQLAEAEAAARAAADAAEAEAALAAQAMEAAEEARRQALEVAEAMAANEDATEVEQAIAAQRAAEAAEAAERAAREAALAEVARCLAALVAKVEAKALQDEADAAAAAAAAARAAAEAAARAAAAADLAAIQIQKQERGKLARMHTTLLRKDRDRERRRLAREAARAERELQAELKNAVDALVSTLEAAAKEEAEVAAVVKAMVSAIVAANEAGVEPDVAAVVESLVNTICAEADAEEAARLRAEMEARAKKQREEVRAATRIQSTHRGNAGRRAAAEVKRLASLDPLEEARRLEGIRREASAVTIQSAERGGKARKEVNALRAERNREAAKAKAAEEAGAWEAAEAARGEAEMKERMSAATRLEAQARGAEARKRTSKMMEDRAAEAERVARAALEAAAAADALAAQWAWAADSKSPALAEAAKTAAMYAHVAAQTAFIATERSASFAEALPEPAAGGRRTIKHGVGGGKAEDKTNSAAAKAGMAAVRAWAEAQPEAAAAAAGIAARTYMPDLSAILDPAYVDSSAPVAGAAGVQAQLAHGGITQGAAKTMLSTTAVMPPQWAFGSRPVALALSGSGSRPGSPPDSHPLASASMPQYGSHGSRLWNRVRKTVHHKPGTVPVPVLPPGGVSIRAEDGAVLAASGQPLLDAQGEVVLAEPTAAAADDDDQVSSAPLVDEFVVLSSLVPPATFLTLPAASSTAAVALASPYSSKGLLAITSSASVMELAAQAAVENAVMSSVVRLQCGFRARKARRLMDELRRKKELEERKRRAREAKEARAKEKELRQKKAIKIQAATRGKQARTRVSGIRKARNEESARKKAAESRKKAREEARAQKLAAATPPPPLVDEEPAETPRELRRLRELEMRMLKMVDEKHREVVECEERVRVASPLPRRASTVGLGGRVGGGEPSLRRAGKGEQPPALLSTGEQRREEEATELEEELVPVLIAPYTSRGNSKQEEEEAAAKAAAKEENEEAEMVEARIEINWASRLIDDTAIAVSVHASRGISPIEMTKRTSPPADPLQAPVPAPPPPPPPVAPATAAPHVVTPPAAAAPPPRRAFGTSRASFDASFRCPPPLSPSLPTSSPSYMRASSIAPRGFAEATLGLTPPRSAAAALTRSSLVGASRSPGVSLGSPMPQGRALTRSPQSLPMLLPATSSPMQPAAAVEAPMSGRGLASRWLNKTAEDLMEAEKRQHEAHEQIVTTHERELARKEEQRLLAARSRERIAVKTLMHVESMILEAMSPGASTSPARRWPSRSPQARTLSTSASSPKLLPSRSPSVRAEKPPAQQPHPQQPRELIGLPPSPRVPRESRALPDIQVAASSPLAGPPAGPEMPLSHYRRTLMGSSFSYSATVADLPLQRNSMGASLTRSAGPLNAM